MNLYSPQQWLEGVLRSHPLVGDKSSALEDPDFHKIAMNSQWVIYSMSKSTKAEDNKKAIKKKPVKPKASEFMIEHYSSYPNTPRTERSEYWVDYGVRYYQVPAESASSTKVLERAVARRTWCIKQRVLWLQGILCNPLTITSGGGALESSRSSTL